MHSRKDCSAATQTALPTPEEAQQVNIADITPRQGFTCCLSGLLILSCETDWRRMGLSWVEAPFGGISARGFCYMASDYS